MQNKSEFLDRFKIMIGEDGTQKIKSARIIVFGVGGVGSALVEFLVRSGVSNITIVDFDKIDVTNINRQLVAFQDNVGKTKVDEMERKLKNINPNINLKKYSTKLTSENINEFNLSNYDIIVDCIDDLNAKKSLITKANELGVYILCACGAGNRFTEIPHFEIADIYKTSYDPIAKILRKYCTENRIKHLEVCYTKQKATKFDCKIVASVVYYPINMATVMCARIIQKILKI